MFKFSISTYFNTAVNNRCAWKFAGCTQTATIPSQQLVEHASLQFKEHVRISKFSASWLKKNKLTASLKMIWLIVFEESSDVYTTGAHKNIPASVLQQCISSDSLMSLIILLFQESLHFLSIVKSIRFFLFESETSLCFNGMQTFMQTFMQIRDFTFVCKLLIGGGG